MLTYSGFFVALWFLPVVLCIIVPLVMFAIWLLGQVPRKVVEPSKTERSEKYEEVIVLTEAQQA